MMERDLLDEWGITIRRGLNGARTFGGPRPRHLLTGVFDGCLRCGTCDPFVLTSHHLHPRAKGGADTADNRIILCRQCHNLIHRVCGKDS